MKFKVVTILLIVSLIVNAILFGKNFWGKYEEANEDEKVILSELIQKTVESSEYQTIAENEAIIAIESSVDKNKGGAYPYYMNVSVRTDKQTYLFSCDNDDCSKVKNYGQTYSRYEDETPKLPLKK